MTTYFLSDSKEQCDWLVSQFIAICNEIGCPVVEEKMEPATQVIMFLWVLLDGRQKMISIPEDKRHSTLQLLKWFINQKKVTINFVQKLTGVLNFLNRALVPGQAFTRGLYEKLAIKDKAGHPLKQYHHVTLTRDFKEDCKVWESFLSIAQEKVNLLNRPF